jgi:hypothetical protein
LAISSYGNKFEHHSLQIIKVGTPLKTQFFLGTFFLFNVQIHDEQRGGVNAWGFSPQKKRGKRKEKKKRCYNLFSFHILLLTKFG